MKLYFVRHGETTYNRDRIIQGWASSELSQDGRSQAIEAGELLARKNIEAIFSSDLLRTKQTSEIIASEMENSIPILYDWRLRERNFGDVENTPKVDVDWDRIFSSPDDAWPFNIESQFSIQSRVKDFVLSLPLVPKKWITVAVVTHGGVLNALHDIVNSTHKRRTFQNCEIVEFDLDALLAKLSKEKL